MVVTIVVVAVVVSRVVAVVVALVIAHIIVCPYYRPCCLRLANDTISFVVAHGLLVLAPTCQRPSITLGRWDRGPCNAAGTRWCCLFLSVHVSVYVKVSRRVLQGFPSWGCKF